MKRTMIVAATMSGIAVTGALSFGVLLPSPAPSRVAATDQRAIFVIANMTCALCPVTVKKAMQGVAGVRSVAVDFNAKTATVVFDPSKTTIAAIVAASTNAGYPAKETKG